MERMEHSQAQADAMAAEGGAFQRITCLQLASLSDTVRSLSANT